MEGVEETGRTAAIAEEGIAGELAALHNNGTIDIVEAFSELRKSEAGFIFFGVRAVFEHALPEIEHDVLPVIRCLEEQITDDE